MPIRENRESCENHGRYRHCMEGGAALDESRSLGIFLRRPCSAEDFRVRRPAQTCVQPGLQVQRRAICTRKNGCGRPFWFAAAVYSFHCCHPPLADCPLDSPAKKYPDRKRFHSHRSGIFLILMKIRKFPYRFSRGIFSWDASCFRYSRCAWGEWNMV